MHYHIILTQNCNSNCRYCYDKSMMESELGAEEKFNLDPDTPVTSEVQVDKLKSFLGKDPEAVLIFYGGEPLIETEKIKEIIYNIDVPFRMQTNGKNLDKLPAAYANKIGKMLISLDGNRERTDHNRGEGTYDKVMDNINLLKKNGYKGELIARMTISYPDLHEQVLELVSSGFGSVHWQLDAGFYKTDYSKEFKKFAEQYNKSTTKLINHWVEQMRKGKVLKLYPLLAIMDSLLKKEKTRLRCGAGHAGYAITTNSNIVACPIMNGTLDFLSGTLDSDPKNLKRFDVSGRCAVCDTKGLCGGRCLYWNYAKSWPEEGDDLICSTIKHLITALRSKTQEIKTLINQGVIKEQDFGYEKYFGPEIIP